MGGKLAHARGRQLILRNLVQLKGVRIGHVFRLRQARDRFVALGQNLTCLLQLLLLALGDGVREASADLV